MGIMRASRQTRLESAPMFFDLNTFNGNFLYCDTLFDCFIGVLEERNRAAIKHLCLRYCHNWCLTRIRLPLYQLLGLQKVTIETADDGGRTVFYEERIRSLVENRAGKRVEVAFIYEVR